MSADFFVKKSKNKLKSLKIKLGNLWNVVIVDKSCLKNYNYSVIKNFLVADSFICFIG